MVFGEAINTRTILLIKNPLLSSFECLKIEIIMLKVYSCLLLMQACLKRNETIEQHLQTSKLALI